MASELLVAAISKSLDGLSLRQIATAQNIANANSSGYVPVRVNFEAALAHAVDDARSNPSLLQEVRDLPVKMTQDPLSVIEEPVRIDQEIATSSTTAMRYAALIGILDRLFQLRTVAVTGS